MNTSARSISEVNKALKGSGYPVELVKGAGYLYFIYDEVEEHNIYETESVMVYAFNRLPGATWIQLGKEFGDKVRKQSGREVA